MGTTLPLSWPRSASGSLRPVRLGTVGLLMVALAACGGGGGGGGGGEPEIQLQVMVINLSNAPVTVSSTSGGEAQTVEACDFDEVDFPLLDPFTLNIADKPVIDSSTLAGGIPGGGEKFVLAEVTVKKDASTEVTVAPYVGRAGGLDRPSALFVKGSCAK